jgi:hypothetical protein
MARRLPALLRCYGCDTLRRFAAPPPQREGEGRRPGRRPRPTPRASLSSSVAWAPPTTPPLVGTLVRAARLVDRPRVAPAWGREGGDGRDAAEAEAAAASGGSGGGSHDSTNEEEGGDGDDDLVDCDGDSEEADSDGASENTLDDDGRLRPVGVEDTGTVDDASRMAVHRPCTTMVMTSPSSSELLDLAVEAEASSAASPLAWVPLSLLPLAPSSCGSSRIPYSHMCAPSTPSPIAAAELLERGRCAIAGWE